MTGIDETIVKFIIDYYKKHQFYPDYDDIAKGVGRTKSTVHIHMKRLEREGVLIRKTDYSPQYRLINMSFILGQKVEDEGLDWNKVIEKMQSSGRL